MYLPVMGTEYVLVVIHVACLIEVATKTGFTVYVMCYVNLEFWKYICVLDETTTRTITNREQYRKILETILFCSHVLAFKRASSLFTVTHRVKKLIRSDQFTAAA